VTVSCAFSAVIFGEMTGFYRFSARDSICSRNNSINPRARAPSAIFHIGGLAGYLVEIGEGVAHRNAALDVYICNS